MQCVRGEYAVTIDYTYHYKKYHDGSVEDTVATVADFRRKLSWLCLPTARDISVLDIGCGAGHCLLALHALGYSNLEGIDADAGQVEVASRHGLKVSHVPVDQFLSYVEARNSNYGLIALMDVLEHIPKEKQIEFLKGLATMLRPDGKLICQVPNADSVVAGRYRYLDWTHEMSFTYESLDFVLHCAGFKTVQAMEDNPNLRPTAFLPLKGWLRWLYRGSMRELRRLEIGAEIGVLAARALPLSNNIMAVAIHRVDSA